MFTPRSDGRRRDRRHRTVAGALDDFAPFVKRGRNHAASSGVSRIGIAFPITEATNMFGRIVLCRGLVAAAVLVAAGCSQPDTSTGVSPSAPVTDITILGAATLVGTAGSPLPAPIAVVATDADGNPVSGATVTFAVTAGGGEIEPASVTTGPDGVAEAAWTLGTTAGANSATATAADLADSTVVFEATGEAGPVARLVAVTTGALAGRAGQALATRLVVRATDAHDNPVADAPVTFKVTRGGGSVAPSTATTGESGEARVTWTLGPAAGANAASATSAGVDTPVAFTATASAPTPAPPTVTTFFTDGFETASAWESDGLWNRSTLRDIRNKALPLYVRLAPGDASEGRLPAPRTGSYAFWYGDPATGNYIDAPAATDVLHSGGTSAGSNSGFLVSPEITIPPGAAHAVLRFDSWFEVEGASLFADNPYIDADVMTVEVIDVATGDAIAWRALSPEDLPSPTGVPADAPLTAAGFDKAPVWRGVALNMSAARGKKVWLAFYFSTVGQSRNGFRGWIVDNVRVTDQPIGASQ